MNAPTIWIILPLVLASLALIPRREQMVTIVGGTVALTLAGIALLMPIDLALRIGPLSLKIASSIKVFGRNLFLGPTDKPFLVIIYGLAALWFFGAAEAGVGRRMIPLGLAITALLVASIAVEPFLYAALLIEMAVLIAIPLLSPPHTRPGRGVVRFLIYQSLAMPFILSAGWLLSGVEVSPGDWALAVQSAAMLGLGFAFLLAIFPLYSWIPLLAEESSPYTVGFILWVLPTITILFGIGFLDRYTWLRTYPLLPGTFQFTGLLMVVTGGLWSAFQRHLGRMMGYAAVVETGFSLLALSLEPKTGTVIVFMLIIPRALGLAIWALALSILKMHAVSLHFNAIKGLARTYPIITSGLILAQLSIAGFPLLAGFPSRLVLWEGIARQSLPAALWYLLGILGMLIGVTRTLAVFVMAPEHTPWEWQENTAVRILIGIGIVLLFILGLFPQVIQPFWTNMPAMLEHLGH